MEMKQVLRLWRLLTGRSLQPVKPCLKGNRQVMAGLCRKFPSSQGPSKQYCRILHVWHTWALSEVTYWPGVKDTCEPHQVTPTGNTSPPGNMLYRIGNTPGDPYFPQKCPPVALIPYVLPSDILHSTEAPLPRRLQRALPSIFHVVRLQRHYCQLALSVVICTPMSWDPHFCSNDQHWLSMVAQK